MTVAFAGWISHMRDRRFDEIFVDRDLSRWQGQSRARQIAATSGNVFGDWRLADDVTNELAAIVTEIPDVWTSPNTPLVEVMYDAGPDNTIESI